MTTTTITADEFIELTREELDEIDGAFWANVAGAAVGAVSGGVSSYLASGGNWRSAAAGAVGGGVAGALNPVGSIASAAMAVGRGAVSGFVAGQANRALGNENPGPSPGAQ
jgi:outer membrane lipoprotein SlyB